MYTSARSVYSCRHGTHGALAPTATLHLQVYSSPTADESTRAAWTQWQCGHVPPLFGSYTVLAEGSAERHLSRNLISVRTTRVGFFMRTWVAWLSLTAGKKYTTPVRDHARERRVLSEGLHSVDTVGVSDQSDMHTAQYGTDSFLHTSPQPHTRTIACYSCSRSPDSAHSYPMYS